MCENQFSKWFELRISTLLVEWILRSNVWKSISDLNLIPLRAACAFMEKTNRQQIRIWHIYVRKYYTIYIYYMSDSVLLVVRRGRGIRSKMANMFAIDLAYFMGPIPLPYWLWLFSRVTVTIPGLQGPSTGTPGAGWPGLGPSCRGASG